MAGDPEEGAFSVNQPLSEHKRPERIAAAAVAASAAVAAAAAVGLAACRAAEGAAACAAVASAPVPTAADEAYMALALDEARLAAEAGEVPIGAVVVFEPIDRATGRPTAEPRVVARAHNLREATKSPSAHAEFLALEQAARALDAWRLPDCTVYVTLEPCIMCAGLMHQARVRRCVFGAPDPKAGACGTLYAIHGDERLNHRFEVVPGVLQEESQRLLREFFATRRKKARAGRGVLASGAGEEGLASAAGPEGKGTS